MLRDMGCDNINQACDSRPALSLLSERRYDLVISGWNMTLMNGLERLRELRNRDPLPSVPFIMMTAHSVRFAAIARDDDTILYLIKPSKSEQLAAKAIQATTKVAA